MLVGAIVLAITGGLVAALQLSDYETKTINTGVRAPAFLASTLATPPVEKSLADYSGRVVLLNIWRTDCLPCEKEMPALERLHEEFKDRGLSVVAVSVEPPQFKQRIRDFTKKHGLTFDILHEPSGAIDLAYRITGWPETFVIGRDGVIKLRIIGDRDWSSMAHRRLIAQIVGTPLSGDTLRPAEFGGGDER